MKPIATGKSCSGLPSSDPGEPSALPTPGSSSLPKYKGVRKRKWGRWVSEIRLPNSRERIWLGSYDSAEKAARAFDAALFCLRGRNAKFNFPSSPPDIAGAHSLSHQEIQAVAARYANERSGPELETGSEVPGSTTDHGRELGMDWSFLGALDENEGRVSDFGFLYGELEYMAGDHQLHTVPAMDGNIRGGVNDGDDHDGNDGNDGNDDNGGGGGGGYTYQSSSFLWNF